MLSFSKATLRDIHVIHKLASEIWVPTYVNILSKEQLEYMFDMMYSYENIQKQIVEYHHQYFIISKDSMPVGYLSIEKINDELFEFQKIYSLPEFHGNGIGRYMIERGVAQIKSYCSTPFVVRLNVNRSNPAIGFYEHMGFRKTGIRDFPIGNDYFMNDYIMELRVM